MSADYIRLAKPPEWCLQYPTCSACMVDLESDGDGWTCPVCGTSWDAYAGDGDTGELYADWAGEESDGPIVDESDAHKWGYYHDRMRSHRAFPDLCPEPKRPDVTR